MISAESRGTECEACFVVRVVRTLLRGAGQVMFQNSAWTGLLFLCGITWGAWRAGRPEMAVGALVGLCVGTLAACMLGAPRGEIEDGLHGYNGILVGCALPVFLESGPVCWVMVVAGAFFSTVIMMAVSQVFRSWKVSAMTGPFVFTTWFMLLASYSFSGIRAVALPHPVLPAPQPDMLLFSGLDMFFHASLTGVSQVFLIDDAITGGFFLAGLAAGSLPAAVYGWTGSLVAMITALLLSVQRRAYGRRHRHDLLSSGLACSTVYASGHNFHRGGSGGAQRFSCPARHSHAYLPLCHCRVAFPAAACRS